MDYKKNEIKAGIMVFVSFTVLAIFLVAIFGIDFGEKTTEYWVYLNYVGGISEGSIVKYMGVNVGQVTEITLLDNGENQVGVKLAINYKTPVKTDSKAFLTSIGLMSDQHIEINPGSPEAALLPPGSVIESKEVLNFAHISETLGDLKSQTQIVLNQVNDLFNEENREHLSAMIGNMDSLMREVRGPFLLTITNLEKSSDQLTKLMDNNDGNLSEILENLKTTTEATNQLITEIRTTVKNFESLMSSNNSNIGEIVENFQAASQNLEEFTRILKEQPWLLVRKAAPPERKSQ